MAKFKSKLGKTEVYTKDNFEVYETTLYIEGITQPKTLLLGADTHLSLTDHRDGQERKTFMWQRRMWFPFASDILEDIVNYPAENPVDFTVLLGDIVDFPSDKNIEVLKDFLSRKTLGSYLYIMGNHDYNFPEENLSGTPAYLSALDALSVRTDGEEKELTPKGYLGGFHAVDLGEVIIAGGNNITKEGRAAFVKGIQDLYGADKPVLISLHRPLLAETLVADVAKAWGKCSMTPAKEDEIAVAALAKESPVAGVLAGDVHFFHTDLVEDTLPQIVVSSQEKKIRVGTPAESRKYWSGIGIVRLLPFENE